VHEWVLQGDCAHWRRHQSISGYRCHFVGPTIELYQCFALHLQLHLGILLEDLRVTLAEHLSYLLIGYPSGTQPCGIRGAEVVNPKVGNLRSSKSLLPNSLGAVWCPLGFRLLGNRNGPSPEIAI
jgi:hypothetical protein